MNTMKLYTTHSEHHCHSLTSHCLAFFVVVAIWLSKNLL
jgi:hypothetical protein